ATSPPATYPLSLHDALPILDWLWPRPGFAQVIHWLLRASSGGLRIAAQDRPRQRLTTQRVVPGLAHLQLIAAGADGQLLARDHRSEEHTSELQSRENLVCRL